MSNVFEIENGLAIDRTNQHLKKNPFSSFIQCFNYTINVFDYVVLNCIYGFNHQRTFEVKFKCRVAEYMYCI